MVLHPSAACELIEIVARIRRFVQRFDQLSRWSDALGRHADRWGPVELFQHLTRSVQLEFHFADLLIGLADLIGQKSCGHDENQRTDNGENAHAFLPPAVWIQVSHRNEISRFKHIYLDVLGELMTSMFPIGPIDIECNRTNRCACISLWNVTDQLLKKLAAHLHRCGSNGRSNNSEMEQSKNNGTIVSITHLTAAIFSRLIGS